MRTDSLALLRQTRVVAANLVASGLTLLFEHLDLVVDVVELLARHGSVAHQFAETLSLALCVGNLLVDGRKLLLKVEPTAVGGTSRRCQLPLLRVELVACLLQLISVDFAHRRVFFDGLSLVNVERLQFARRLRRNGDFGRLERACGVVFFLARRTRGDEG